METNSKALWQREAGVRKSSRMLRAERSRSLSAAGRPRESARPEHEPEGSVPVMLLRRVEATPDNPAFLHPEGDGWKTLTWRQTGDRVRAIACGLLSLGLAPEERCAIFSSTRME